MKAVFTVCVLAFSAGSFGQGVYQAPDAFLADTFKGEVPAAKSFWITRPVKPFVQQIMGHGLKRMRVRYWLKGKRSAWILEEIGKEEYITVGFVVNNNKIERVKVLVFRESRGWEIRYPFFTRQFTGAALKTDRELDRSIDGITGATLSVRAVTRLGRLALYFHQQVMKDNE